jgi:hypothetical protein
MLESSFKNTLSNVDDRRAALIFISNELQSLESLGNMLVEMKPAGNLPLKASSILTVCVGVGRLLGRLEILTRLPIDPVLGPLTKDVSLLSFDIAKAIGEDNFRQQLEGLRRANKTIPTILTKIRYILRENRT